MSALVSLVVINYNGSDFFKPCLDSILAQTRPAEEVILVDNASTDGSPEQIRQQYGDRIRIVASPRNAGFAAACNLGIKSSSGSHIGILNNDVCLDCRWLEAMLEQDSPRWDFWASRIVFEADQRRVDSAGDGMAVIGAGYKIGHGEESTRHGRRREVFGACAAAALYRRNLLEDLGGFDPEFFLIYEDADLNLRARLRGYRCLFVPGARVRHRVNASLGTLSRNYVYYGQRNSEFVFWQNMPTRLILLYLPERLLFNLAALVYFSLHGQTAAFLKAKWDFLKALPRVFEKRRRIQARRTLSSFQIRKHLDRNWLRYRRNIRVSA